MPNSIVNSFDTSSTAEAAGRSLIVKKRVLLLGGTGFAGRHLARELGAPFSVRVSGSEVDVRDRKGLRKLLDTTEPDFIVHLAAMSSVPASIENPREVYEVNFQGLLNVLTELQETRFSGRFLYVGSSQVYGRVDEHDLPISETHPLRPTNPYGVSKVAAEALCHQVGSASRFDVVMARPFNHIGTGQSESFAI